MKIISHRGNINGPGPSENSPALLLDTISKGFDVEIDIRLLDGIWYLGHDEPKYPVGDIFIDQIKDKGWLHCKNLDALFALNKQTHNFFWHQNDDFTLTSKGFIWTYPNKPVTKKSIIVDLNLTNFFYHGEVYGACTDYPILI